MLTGRIDSAGGEKRRDRRYCLPILEVAIGDERFRAVNWSMQGVLLYGICELVGVRVRGEMGVPGSIDAVPFAATVIRADLDSGNCAICFEDCRTDRIEFEYREGAALQ
jgi:hypothetical protein